MRRVIHIAAFLLVASFAGVIQAQDLALISIEAPRSGCALHQGENVTLRLFNYGPNLPAGSTFSVSYSINAGAPATEFVVLGSTLLTNSRFDYSFATPADLSVPGTYTIDATVDLPGDINPANNAYTDYLVTNWSPSIGGTASGPGEPMLDGSVVLSGYTGVILEWQQSEDLGRRWRRLANRDATLDFGMLRTTTLFRARIRNGLCEPALSGTATVRSSDPIFRSGFEP
jgi:hypothetical protein